MKNSFAQACILPISIKFRMVDSDDQKLFVNVEVIRTFIFINIY